MKRTPMTRTPGCATSGHVCGRNRMYVLAGALGIALLTSCGGSGGNEEASALSITSASPPAGTTGEAYSGYTFSASGGSPPLNWAESGSLPRGLVLNETGQLSGTPATAGTYGLSVSVTDSSVPPLTATVPVSLKINDSTIIVAATAPPPGTVTLPYPRFAFGASGGSPPYTWKANGSLPPGLMLGSDGTLSGIPTLAGSFSFDVTATDSAQSPVSGPPLAAHMDIITLPPPPPNPVLTLNVTPASVPAGQSAVLTWSSTGWASTGVTTCGASDAWTGAQLTVGRTLTAPTTPGSYVYSLSCTNLTQGLQVSATTNLTVTPNGFSDTDLVANISGTAARTVDANLADPWGIALQPKQAAVVANRESNASTSYDGSGVRQSVGPVPAALLVHLPAAVAGAGFNPTGVVAPSTGAFMFTGSGKSGAALLVYAGESGRLAAWSPAVDAANAFTVYAASDGAVYRGLAVSGDLLYAADFYNGKIDVFNLAFAKQARSATSYPFADPALPPGYAPFGIALNGSTIYVAYARRLAPANRDAVSGAGLGLVDTFDLNGNFLKRLVAPGGSLNAPWGIALAPAGNLDVFSSMLLIANTGDGHIHAFDPATGGIVGTVNDPTGTALTIPRLHGIAFGNRYANQPDVSLFFTAGASNGAAGSYGRIDFGARPRLHAPPKVTVSIETTECNIWICGGFPDPVLTYHVIPAITDISGIGKVEIDVVVDEVVFFKPQTIKYTRVSNAEPYGVSYGFSRSRFRSLPSSFTASATVTDVDGNVASSP